MDLAIARVITDAITDDGYLKDDLEEVRLSLLPEIEATTADVERVLAAVQSLEPAGVGERPGGLGGVGDHERARDVHLAAEDL